MIELNQSVWIKSNHSYYETIVQLQIYVPMSFKSYGRLSTLHWSYQSSNLVSNNLMGQLINNLGNGDASITNIEQKQIFEEELESRRIMIELLRNQILKIVKDNFKKSLEGAFSASNKEV